MITFAVDGLPLPNSQAMIAAAKTVVRTSHTLLLTRTSEVWAWGYNGQGQLGRGSDVTGVSNATPGMLKFFAKERAQARHRPCANACAGVYASTLSSAVVRRGL